MAGSAGAGGNAGGGASTTCSIPPNLPGFIDLPQKYVDISMPTPSGSTTHVKAGDDLQARLDAAQPGDTLVLEAGATWVGEYYLRAKSNPSKQWIVIKSSAMNSLPGEGARVKPAQHHQYMPKILAPKNPVSPKVSTKRALRCDLGASHYRIMGVEFGVESGVNDSFGVVELGHNVGNWGALNNRPNHIVLDRVYIHGVINPVPNPAGYSGSKRGLYLNGSDLAVINSHISDFQRTGQTSQAISGHSGKGPYKIANNYLEASAINLVFGGDVTPDASHNAKDIEVCNNHFRKDPKWFHQDKNVWEVKNLFELKHGHRVLVTGNVLENNWKKGQVGYAILIKSSAQWGDASQTHQKTEDLVFAYNIISDSEMGLNISGGGSNSVQTGPTSDIYIAHNVFEKLGPDSQFGGQGRGFQVLKSPVNLTIANNTMFNHYQHLQLNPEASWGPGVFVNFQFKNNIVDFGLYGVHGTSGAHDEEKVANACNSHVFAGNVVRGAPAKEYPSGLNSVASSWTQVGFTNMSGGDYELASSSPFLKAGTNGSKPGADWAAIKQATAGVK